MFQKLLYHNQHILITGASSGLGRNMALNYAKNGATIINLSRNLKKMKSLQQELQDINPVSHKYYSLDISDYQEVKKVKSDLLKNNIFPDVVINNAAGNFLCPFYNLSENGFNRVLEIVLKGNFNTIHLFGKEMIRLKKNGIF